MTKKVREGILEGTVDSSGVARMNGKIQEIYKIIPAIQDKVKDSFPHYSEASSTVKAASSVGLTVSTISVICFTACGCNLAIIASYLVIILVVICISRDIYFTHKSAHSQEKKIKRV